MYKSYTVPTRKLSTPWAMKTGFYLESYLTIQLMDLNIFFVNILIVDVNQLINTMNQMCVAEFLRELIVHSVKHFDVRELRTLIVTFILFLSSHCSLNTSIFAQPSDISNGINSEI